MHLIRRSALRAAASPSLAAQSRSIVSTPFAVRSKVQNSISSSVFRRFNSDDATKVGSADGEASAVHEAIESASDANGYPPRERREFTPREPRNAGYNTSRNERIDRGRYGGSGSSYGGGRDMGRGRDSGPREPRVMEPAPGVYVGNLLFDVTAADLQREFEPFGTIKNVIIATDNRGLSKGFGYVHFETVEQATAAIQGKDQQILEGRRLSVNYMSMSPRRDTSDKPSNPPSKTLFIGNLAFEMSDSDLNKLFRDVRNVLDVRVAIDRRTGQPRGFAHADFLDVESAVAAKEYLTGKDCYGRALRIDFSTASRDTRGDGGASRNDRF